MTHYIKCPRECEGEVAFVLDKGGVPDLDQANMVCSEGHTFDNCEQDRLWNEADSRAHEWEVADAEAIVEASARAHFEEAQ